MTNNELFTHHMNGMLEHYTSGATHSYALPIELLHSDPEDDTRLLVASAESAEDSAGAAVVDQGLNDFKTTMTSVVNDSSGAAQKGVDTLKSSKADEAASAAFVASMKKQEAAMQKKAHDQIAKNFQTLIDTGKKHPHQQKRIVSATQQIGAFFTALLVKVAKFFQGLVNSITDFFKSVGKWFEDAYNSVKNWTEGAVRSVEHFFSSIF